MSGVNTVVRFGIQMRNKFVSKMTIDKWYPRHMFSALKAVHGKIHGIDAVIEVHDARIALTGRNQNLEEINIIRPSVLVLNKIDLISEANIEKLKETFTDHPVPVVFLSCKKNTTKSLNELISSVIDVSDQSSRQYRLHPDEVNLLMLGIPNVGKSSLLNCLRSHGMKRKKHAIVAPHPGVTRSVMEKVQISYTPKIFIRDTPGVLDPKIPTLETALKLCLVNTINEKYFNNEVLSDYLLYWLNCHGHHEYVREFSIARPTDEIDLLLTAVALKLKLFQPLRGKNIVEQAMPYFHDASLYFIQLWRNGMLGCGLLEDIVNKAE